MLTMALVIGGVGLPKVPQESTLIAIRCNCL